MKHETGTPKGQKEQLIRDGLEILLDSLKPGEQLVISRPEAKHAESPRVVYLSRIWEVGGEFYCVGSVAAELAGRDPVDESEQENEA